MLFVFFLPLEMREGGREVGAKNEHKLNGRGCFSFSSFLHALSSLSSLMECFPLFASLLFFFPLPQFPSLSLSPYLGLVTGTNSQHAAATFTWGNRGEGMRWGRQAREERFVGFLDRERERGKVSFFSFPPLNDHFDTPLLSTTSSPLSCYLGTWILAVI